MLVQSSMLTLGTTSWVQLRLRLSIVPAIVTTAHVIVITVPVNVIIAAVIVITAPVTAITNAPVIVLTNYDRS